MPTSRVFANGDLVLVDAGAEVRGYASDVTRTYPASGSFTPEQQALHTLVAASCTAAIEQCAPGNEWLDVHATAAGALLQDEQRRRKHADAVDWDRVDRMLDFGGIRIEHNVLITEDGFEILTAEVPLLG